MIGAVRKYKAFFMLILTLLVACAPSVNKAEDARQATLSVMVETMAAEEALTKSTHEPAVNNTARVTVQTETITDAIVTPTETPLPTITFTPTEDTRIPPRQWASYPILPVVSHNAVAIYQKGIAMGNNPHLFTVVGDCQSAPNVFLGIYDTQRYSIHESYAHLEETIDHFQGAFSHESLSVVDGLSAPSALSPLWANQDACDSDENPVACELRVNRPSIIFINLGTVWKAGASADKYREYLEQIVQIVIDNGAVPILSTKADNVEGDHSINRVTAQVAYDYDIPLWNFWAAADSLPNHGLDAGRDNIYLTPEGWDRRNFTGLQTLDVVWRTLQAGAVQ